MQTISKRLATHIITVTIAVALAIAIALVVIVMSIPAVTDIDMQTPHVRPAMAAKSLPLNSQSMSFQVMQQGNGLIIISNQLQEQNQRQNQYPDQNHAQILLPILSDKQVIDFAIQDVDDDGNDEILTLIGKQNSIYGDDLVIYSLGITTNGLLLEEIYRNTIEVIKPWKITTCEIDGDGQPDIFIGVRKSTEYYPEIANRPFFFTFEDGILVKKWTGSKVRHPFTDVYFADLNQDGRDYMIVIEQRNQQEQVIALYHWFGFGFALLAESPSYTTINSIKPAINEQSWHLEVNVSSNGHNRTIQLLPVSDKTANEIYQLQEK